MNNRRNINIFFSNLFINKYLVKNDEIDNFKDVLQSYYDEHTNKFNKVPVCVIWKKTM